MASLGSRTRYIKYVGNALRDARGGKLRLGMVTCQGVASGLIDCYCQLFTHPNISLIRTNSWTLLPTGFRITEDLLYVENAQRNTESYYLLQHKHPKSPASHSRMLYRIIIRIRTCYCTRTYKPVSFPCIRPQTLALLTN